MKKIICEMLSCPKLMPASMALIAASALGMALISQYIFGLNPCNLCIIQRFPYGIVIALGIIGFAMSFKCNKGTSAIMGLIGLTFLANSVIAFYHSGVERHWWKSFLEGCAVPDLGENPDNIIALLENTKAARCDEIPWADPILGLSMANYNVGFCLVLGIVAIISATKICKKSCNQ
jgi:disulfide bond formation protein DsbB